MTPLGPLLCVWDIEASHISKTFGILPVGMAMCSHTVECYKAVFQSPPLLCCGDKGSPEASIMRNSAIISSSPFNTDIHQKQLKKCTLCQLSSQEAAQTEF